VAHRFIFVIFPASTLSMMIFSLIVTFGRVGFVTRFVMLVLIVLLLLVLGLFKSPVAVLALVLRAGLMSVARKPASMPSNSSAV
jgi:hypothetical protein